MSSIMYGKCEVCGKDASLQRTYFRYNMPCECHNGYHSEHVDHCNNCVPKEPKETKVVVNTEKLKQVVIMDVDKFEHLLNCMCRQKYMPIDNLSAIEEQEQETIDKAYHSAKDLLNQMTAGSDAYL